MADSAGRPSLSDEQWLALGFEDLCDADYLARLHAEVSRGCVDEALDTPQQSALVAEDLLNFGECLAAAAGLLRRRAEREAALEAGLTDAHFEAIGKQVAVAAHIAAVLRRLSERLPAVPRDPQPAGFPEDALLRVALRGLSVSESSGCRVKVQNFESALTPLLDALTNSSRTSPLLVAQFFNMLGLRFEASLRTIARDRAGSGSFGVATLCCLFSARLSLRLRDGSSLLLALTQTLALRAQALASLDSLERQAVPAASGLALVSSTKNEEDTAALRLKRKLSDAKLAGKCSPADLERLEADGGDRSWQRQVSAPAGKRPSTGAKAVAKAVATVKDRVSRGGGSDQRNGVTGPAPGEEKLLERTRAQILKALQALSAVPDDLLVASQSEDAGLAAEDGDRWIRSEVHACGQNSYGELGQGDAEQRRSFCRLQAVQEKGVVDVGAGNEHSVLVTSSGTVLSAGYNDNGQCGVGSTTQIRQLTQLSSLQGEKVTRIFAANGCEHTLLLTQSGKVYSCGYNYRGQLGLVTLPANTPAAELTTSRGTHLPSRYRVR